MAQAYLLGQLVRSKDSPKGFGELLIDFAMKKVKEAIAKDEAEKIAEQLKKAGAEVEVK